MLRLLIPGLLLAAACGTSDDGGVTPADGGPDAAVPGDAAPDGALPDAGDVDGAFPDGDVPDGALADAGDADGALPDGDVLDGALLDAALDGGLADGDVPDGALLDAALDAAPEADAAPDLGPPPPDAAPDAATEPDRCAEWADLADQALVDALHAHLYATYRPIDVRPDLGGRPNRYTTARNHMFVDVEWAPDGADGRPGYVCLYTGRAVEHAESEPDDDLLNTEHVRPRSKLNPDRQSLLYSHQQSDIHHLFPTLPGVNSARGSDPFGEPVSDRRLDWLPAERGRDAAGRQVFQPRVETRGDVARAMFYMTVRWGLDLPAHEEAVLRRWHVDDPVDPRDVERNDRVEAIQGTRNPFVDCPELVDAIGDFAAFPSLDTEGNVVAP